MPFARLSSGATAGRTVPPSPAPRANRSRKTESRPTFGGWTHATETGRRFSDFTHTDLPSRASPRHPRRTANYWKGWIPSTLLSAARAPNRTGYDRSAERPDPTVLGTPPEPAAGSSIDLSTPPELAGGSLLDLSTTKQPSLSGSSDLGTLAQRPSGARAYCVRKISRAPAPSST